MAEQKQKSEGKEKKSSKMLIIIIVAVVLLLGGGGATYYFLWMDQSSESADDEPDDEEEDKNSEEEPATSDALYYDVSKPFVVDFPPGSAARLIQVSVSLSVSNQETVDALAKHDPMIRNNLLMLISKEGAESLSAREGKEKLREAMLIEVGSVLKKLTGKNQVKEVFFTSFVMQ